MKTSKLKKILKTGKIIILDGSTGAALQKRGMPKGVCPEKWALDNPERLIKLQKEYIKAGSRMLYTFTLGGTRPKLDEFGHGKDVEAINMGLAKITRKAAGKKILVAGDMGPTGHFPKPFGDMEFEDCVNIFKEQARGLLKGGIDLFVIETMIDIQEARAALIACKELSSLPVMVSMTFDRDKRTLTGTDPVSAVITLQALGADVVGVNCSTGPKEMVKVIEAMKPFAKVPIMAKPNAGLPRLVDGNTVFDMKAAEFASYTKPLIRAGACLIGGCCGTSPEYIKLVRANSKVKSQKSKVKLKSLSMLSSARKAVFIGPEKPVTIVGERINPTGKKQLQEELKQGNTAEVRRFAVEQTENGALILDVNVGMPGIDEKETMKKVISLLSAITDAPLCIDSSSPEVIEAGLRIYPGRALINSISGEPEKLKKLLPLAAKYGAMFILLPIGAKGVPETAKERQIIANKVIAAAEKYGYTNKDIVIDGLVMTVSSNQESAKETLKLIEWASHYGFNSIVGLSNVSFGLPECGLINSTFLDLAVEHGLTMAIANPSADFTLISKDAEAVLMGRDAGCRRWVEKYGGTRNSELGTRKLAPAIRDSKPETIHDAVVNGNKEIIAALIQKALGEGQKPNEIVDTILIPAIAKVGDLYDKKVYFLPQLISSAEAMKAGFAVLEPLLAKSTTDNRQPATVVLATVKGDIHDIGKNIVALMLKNYGFKVYDLGKDVDEHAIVRKAKETGAAIIGLSALMTTTMVEMKTVIELAKKEGLNCKFMIGGAVITQAYADEIGADGYSKDAYEAVKLAKKLSEKNQGA
jgi:5-methyltetrahydrofolate--homocysteine methyltransferase